MPSSDYFRKQAQVFARLARNSSNEAMAGLYTQMTLECLAKAEELEPSASLEQMHFRDESQHRGPDEPLR